MEKIAFNIGQNFNSPLGKTVGLGDLTSIIITAAITISGIVVLFMFIGGGYSMIAGAGNSDPQRAAQGKQAVTWAVVGFIIIFIAYWIVRIIEVITGSNLITNPGF